MTRIGLLSDTHSYLPNGVFRFFENCDEIWHAGDIGSISLAKKIAAFKPLKAVYGNIDGQDLRTIFPAELKFLCEDTKVYLTHIGGYPGKYDPSIVKQLFADPPKLFISGHSHILKVINDKKLKLLHINPGAAGKYGFHNVITFVRFEIEGANIQNLSLMEVDKNTKDGEFFY